MEITEKKLTKISRSMSLVLRHAPEKAGLTLDKEGWASVELLLNWLWAKGHRIKRDDLEQVVANNNKKRFEFSEDLKKIRARQGHSIKVDLGYQPAEPPETLYHGTVSKVLDLIRKGGLKKMSRHAVHLSPDTETAINVGSRRGRPVILKVAAKKMHDRGYKFYLTENNVWLTEAVPAEYLVDPPNYPTDPPLTST